MRRLPAELGGLYFPASVEGGAKFLRLNLAVADAALTGFAMRHVKTGARVWDVGANVGLFTFTAAGLAGPEGEVIAIEADTWLVGNLRDAVRRNKQRGAPVSVIPVAASDSFGIAEFNIARQGRATNFLSIGGGSSMTGGIRTRQTVPTMPLDALLDYFRPPDVVKIDVEGAESLVLRGASRILEHHPVLMVEAFPEHSEVLHGLLEPFGYEYRDAATGKQVARPSFNFVATPVIT